MKLSKVQIIFLALLKSSLCFSSPIPSSKNMCSSQKILLPSRAIGLEDLNTPVQARDLLGLIRTVSENFLLLDQNFHQDNFLLELFNSKSITYTYAGIFSGEEAYQYKKIWTSNHSNFKNNFKIDVINSSFVRLKDVIPNKIVSRLTITTDADENPFTFALIEHEFGANFHWHDPLKENLYGNIHLLEASAHRSPATHAKAYLETEYLVETDKCLSKLAILLNQKGNLRQIELQQMDK